MSSSGHLAVMAKILNLICDKAAGKGCRQRSSAGQALGQFDHRPKIANALWGFVLPSATGLSAGGKKIIIEINRAFAENVSL